MNSLQIKSTLENQFGLVSKNPNRSKALCYLLPNGEAIYLKRKSSDKGAEVQPMSTAPVVIHLKHKTSLIALIAQSELRNELEINGKTKSTGFVTLKDEESLDGGATPTGLALNIRSKRALSELINLITA
tara:strand:- start:39 stop:428 length:390 start_codon:yes stop_codon:yes gene_type:complete